MEMWPPGKFPNKRSPAPSPLTLPAPAPKPVWTLAACGRPSRTHASSLLGLFTGFRLPAAWAGEGRILVGVPPRACHPTPRSLCSDDDASNVFMVTEVLSCMVAHVALRAPCVVDRTYGSTPVQWMWKLRAWEVQHLAQSIKCEARPPTGYAYLLTAL